MLSPSQGGILPTGSNGAIRKRRSEMNLERILKVHTEHIQKEIDDFKQVENYFKSVSKKSRSVVMRMCSSHIKAMDEVIQDIKGNVVVSFFAKPGYGKSFMINNIISGFNNNYQLPVPSGKSNEKGLTATVIDVMYGKCYQLIKVMCTQDEYLLRLKILNKMIPDRFESNDYQYRNQTEIIDQDESLTDENTILSRANSAISQFEKNKSDLQSLTVKKLVLYIPSKYLFENKIIVRDMPGYDEHSQSKLYAQYIKESMEDTCILFSGIENSRSIFDSGLVKKYWEHGIYSPKQLFPPTILIGINDKAQTDTKLYESNDLVSDFQTIRESFRDQIANFFNVDIKDANLLQNNSAYEGTNIIEDKQEFVNSVYNNFSVLVFPPLNYKSEEFENQFLAQIEQARAKVIEKNCDKLRDIAIFVLSNLLSKFKEKEVGDKDFQKKLSSIRNDISKKLDSKIEQTKTVAPTLDLFLEGMDPLSPEQFTTTLHGFFKKGVDECFNMSDIDEMFEKAKKSKYPQEKKKEWEEVFEKLKNNFLETIETMKTNVNNLVGEFHNFLISKLSAIELKLNQKFVEDIVLALDPEDESDIEEELIKEIYDYIRDYESNLTEYLKVSEKIENLNMLEKDKIKHLLEQYKKKKPQSETLEITLNSRLHTPQIAPSSGLTLPSMNCNDLQELKSKEYVASIDPVIRYSLKKSEKSSLVLERDHSNEKDEISISFDRNLKKLSVSYSKKMEELCSKFRQIKKNGKDSKEKDLTEIKLAPIFLISRPRGNWIPNLMVSDVQQLVENNVNFLFFIVTERCYVERYKKTLRDSGVGDSHYQFLILEESAKVGYARVETCVFLTCERLQFQSAIIMHDDIRNFYEYLQDQKITINHKYAMMRSCLQLEDTLYEELFAPKQINEYVGKLGKILTVESLKVSFSSLIKEIRKVTNLTDEETEEKATCIFDFFSSLKNNDSRHNALMKVAQNPNECIYFCKLAQLGVAGELEKLFDRTSHIGRVSLYDYQTKPAFKNKVLGLNKPTHTLSNSKSAVHIYNIAAMRGIHAITDEEFWNQQDNTKRKQMLEKFKKRKKSKKNVYALHSKAAVKGYRYSDVNLKAQMLYYGVGSFQLFSFAFSSNSNAPSLHDYKDTKRGNKFDSDREEEPTLEIVSSKKRKRNTKSTPSKKTKQ